MKIKKELKKVLEVICNCPAMYSQNILHKNFDHRDFCQEQGMKICGNYLDCPMWKKRLDCWKAMNDWDDRFNSR